MTLKPFLLYFRYLCELMIHEDFLVDKDRKTSTFSNNVGCPVTWSAALANGEGHPWPSRSY